MNHICSLYPVWSYHQNVESSQKTTRKYQIKNADTHLFKIIVKLNEDFIENYVEALNRR